jgi:hypothetical protein
MFSDFVVAVCCDLLEKHIASIFKVVETDSGGCCSNLKEQMFQLYRKVKGTYA